MADLRPHMKANRHRRRSGQTGFVICASDQGRQRRIFYPPEVGSVSVFQHFPHKKIVCWTIGLICLALIVFNPFVKFIVWLACCQYCEWRSSDWKAADNRKEFESRIYVPCRKNDVAASQTMFVKTSELKPGQQIVRYEIFGSCPLVVVYNSDSSIDKFFKAYLMD